MTNCCIRVAGNTYFLNFVHSSGEYSAILAATRHGGETLCEILKKHQNMEKQTVRDEIVEVVNKLFVYTDSQMWEKLQKFVFSPLVQFDMSSVGGENKEMKSSEICELWNEGFKNIDSVNHLAGNYIVEIRDADAFVFAYATATHYKDSAINGKTREFVGTYEIELINEDLGWRINSFKYNLKYATGNLDLK